MSKFAITKIALFVVVVIAGDYVGGGLMQQLFMKTKFRYAMLYKGELPADIAIIGNSRGLHMFHPPSIESESDRKVANLAFNALPAEAMPIIWKDYLVNHAAPKLLIVEVSCIAAENEPGSVERLSLLADQNTRFAELISESDFYSGAGNRISRLHRYNSSLMWRSLLFLRNSDQSWIMNSELNPEMMEQLVSESDNRLLKIPEKVAAIKEVIETAQAADVGVKLIFAPYLPEFYRRLEAPMEWREWLEDELNHEILNYTQLLTKTEHFSDHIHLNESGAKELARKLNIEGVFNTD